MLYIMGSISMQDTTHMKMYNDYTQHNINTYIKMAIK